MSTLRSIAVAVLLLPLAGYELPSRLDTRSPIAAAGACVDPIADARRRLGDADGGIDVGTVSVLDAPDLDGDGTADLQVEASGYCGSGGCAHELYLRRGVCSRYVGEVSGNDVVPTDAHHRGFVDVTTELHAGSTEWGEYTASMHEDGEYHADLERDCRVVASARGDEEPLCKPWRAITSW